MSPKNSKIFFLFYIFFSLCQVVFSQNNITSDTISASRLDYLIVNDSLFDAAKLLNRHVEYAKKHNQQELLAKSYSSLGTVFSKMGSYKIAETFYLDAFKIYDSLQNKTEVDNVLASLVTSYTFLREYKKFDSLIPIAESLSKELNSKNVFTNLESKIQKRYFLFQNQLMLESSTEALNKIQEEPFSFSKVISEKERKRLALLFTYYKANALIKLRLYKEGYKLLFNIDANEFEKSIDEGMFSFEKIATLNFYKFEYYSYYNKQTDSANKYLLLADTYKYNAIKKVKQKNSENGSHIYKIINTQEQLKTETRLREKDIKVSNAFLISTIISALLVIVLAGFLYYHYRNKRKIKFINTKLKTSNQKLLEIDKERLEFFSVLSHELRTPIYGINGLATLIEQEESIEKKQSYINALKSSSNYISILIDNVLEATQLKFGNKTLRLKPVSIADVIKNISNTIKASAKNKGLEIKTNINKTHIGEFVLADHVALSQILINLTYNAIRYTNFGYVSINVTEKERTENDVSLLFEIKDTGIGIKDEYRKIVFNAFKNKSFLNKNSNGSGLGLFIVKTLLKSYESDIDFNSSTKGSNFFFTIKFKTCQSAKKIASDNKNDLKINQHVLVVDDNNINLLITKKNVARIAGYTCETARSGKDAIALIEKKHFDLVLMDINMPEMNGFEATKHIKKINPNIPVLALTALNSYEISNNAQLSGMNQVLTKPYIFEEFESVLLSYSKKVLNTKLNHLV